ncbi:hypothetical protein Pan258_30300 [Symmachiella dynata]|nr:hypothetical protein Pan258_30300 [Symmachiella dynata]
MKTTGTINDVGEFDRETELRWLCDPFMNLEVPPLAR